MEIGLYGGSNLPNRETPRRQGKFAAATSSCTFALGSLLRPCFSHPSGEQVLMARVTVEDCIDKVENRFDLVLLASHRARMISSGTQITVDRDNDKNPVVALREIADETVSPGDLKEELIHTLQKYAAVH